MTSKTLLVLLFFFTSFAYANDDIELPRIDAQRLKTMAENASLWRLPDINPSELKEGIFYYGILYDGVLFYSTVHEKEAKVGQRAGGHFKIIREIFRLSAIDAGYTSEQSEHVTTKIQRIQATRSDTFHDGIAFGFKAIRSQQNELEILWHGFNSFKSTIHGTMRPLIIQPEQFEYLIMNEISHIYNAPAMVVHPIDDPNILLNPKYLDQSYE